MMNKENRNQGRRSQYQPFRKITDTLVHLETQRDNCSGFPSQLARERPVTHTKHTQFIAKFIIVMQLADPLVKTVTFVNIAKHRSRKWWSIAILWHTTAVCHATGKKYGSPWAKPSSITRQAATTTSAIHYFTLLPRLFAFFQLPQKIYMFSFNIFHAYLTPHVSHVSSSFSNLNLSEPGPPPAGIYPSSSCHSSTALVTFLWPRHSTQTSRLLHLS